jgi:hypothetical protein
MTQSQIQYLLSYFDSEFSDGITTLYEEDVWMDMEEISEIILASNENIYPDEGLQVKFDSATELIFVREGYYASESFVTVRDAYRIPYSQVVGMMISKTNSTKSPYKKSSSI